MLKRLFLVIFILQSLASTAWAGMDMSRSNAYQQTQMQILQSSMYHTLDLLLTQQSPKQPAYHQVMACDQTQTNLSHMDMDCCQNPMTCHNLLCHTAQLGGSFVLIPSAITLPNLHFESLSTQFSPVVLHSAIQPETPPPPSV
jgi:hypothetical protein